MFGRIKCVVLLISVASSVSECKLQRKERAVNETDDGKSSLAFVFDVTGSMYNDLRQLREGAEMILNTALEESNVIADFVFVPFHDPAVGPATVTKSKEVFKKALNIVRVYGGGDCPEMSLTGIQLALNVSRPKSFLYVFTDATSIDHRKIDSVLDTIQRKQSQVVFILTGHCNDLDKPTYKVYQQVAAASSGQIFNLNKTSVHKMLEFVKSSIKGRTVNLASVSNPAGYNYTQEIPVDSSLGEVTVSVSGAKPQITVVDPKGEQLTGPPKLITTLDLSEIMVVKVMQPEPGNWTITVGSEEDYSVKVVGLSNLTFNHGFSVVTPRSMKETSYRPLKGTYNHMMISLTKTNVSADIQYAEILTLDGKPLFEMPLIEVDGVSKVYRAEPFIPPDDLFYIAINGRDQNNQELRRVGATAIQAKLPDVPYLTSPRKVEARSHSRVVLTCDVESLVPVNVMWTKDGSRMLKQFATLQTTSIDYVIEDMTEEDVGIYRCVAKNVAGLSKAATELSIIVDPPQVTIEPGNTTVEAGDTVTVTCTVYSEALLWQNKLVFNGTDTHYAIDLDKNPNIEGLYTYNKTIQISENETGLYSCIASNRGGETNQTTRITIKMNPTAHILGPHTLSKSIHSDFQLVCAVENAQQVVWSTPRNSEVKKSDVNGTLNDVLEIKDVADDEIWTCFAVRGALKGSDSVTVTMLIKPEVSIPGDKTMTIINGTVVDVTCIVTAKPPPRTLWHRETEKFLNNTITEIKPSVYQSVLTLNSSAEDVSGTYFCFGENSEGINQDSVTVSVRRKMTLVKGFDDQSVQLYYQIELQCIIDAYPPAVIQWYHNGTSLVLNDNVHVTEDNTTVYLKRVDFSDLGEYRCEGANVFEKVEATGSVRVDGLAPPMLSKEPGSMTAREGEPIVIPCRILQGSPEPAIIWQHKLDEHAEFSSPPKDVVVNYDRFELKIPGAMKGHRGVYRCVADNVIGQDFYDVTLVVQYPPKLLQSPKVDEKPLEVKLGQRLKLSCEASGVPPPLTVWTKDGKPITYTDNLIVTDMSELEIREASSYNSGTYTCNVTSAVGSTHKNFTVIIYEPPSITTPLNPTLEMLEGQLVELPCNARGTPTPQVEWTFNGDYVGDSKHVDENGLRFVANLTDFGEYTCKTKNEYGNAAITYTLHVWAPPMLSKEPGSMTAREGEPIVIPCRILQGSPEPAIIWQHKLDEHAEFSSPPKDVVVNYDRFELKIPGAMKGHRGVYRCVADNVIGQDFYDVTLVVQYPPKLLQSPKVDEKPLEVKLGERLKLSCEASGVPPPLTVWTKDGKPITFTDNLIVTDMSELEIREASSYNSGTYTCNVTSAVGSTHKNFTVIIYEPPSITTPLNPTLEMLEGQLVELPCNARGTPTPQVEWTFNGDYVGDSKHVDENGLRFVANLTDFGEYTCKTKNEYGNAAITYTLHVWAPPMLSKEPSSMTAREGEPIVIPCRILQGSPEPAIIWQHKLDEHAEFSSPPKDVVVNYDRFELKIPGAMKGHRGVYRCVADNVIGQDFYDVTLVVQYPPKLLQSPKVDEKPLEVKLGERLKLSCEASGVPPPLTVWTKDGKPITYTDNLIVTDMSELEIREASSYNSGTYTCNVTSAVGSTHKNFTVIIYEPPSITTPLNPTLEMLEGQLVELPCNARGTPTPQVEWTFNGDYVGDSKHVDENGLRFVANLTDFGEYTCKTKNEYGNAAITYTLHVWVQPFIIPPSKLSHEVLRGSNATMQCDIIGFPIPSITWKFNENTLKQNTTDVSFNDVGNIYIHNASEKHDGDYVCVAENAGGIAEQPFFLVVNELPQIMADNYTGPYLATNVDTVLSIPCIATGKPKPYVLWAKDEFYLNKDSRYTIDSDGTLLIHSPSEDLSGKYTCVAKNYVGEANKTVVVEIYSLPAPPQSEESTTSVTLLEGTDATVDCPVRATAHSIKWYKDAKLIATGPLSLPNVSRDNSSSYSCVVTNAVGSAHATLQLVVEWPPKLKQGDSFVETVRGDDAFLHCDADAKPEAKTKWVFNSKPLAFEDKSSLKLINAQLHNAGSYKCIVSNVHGTVVKEFTTNVLEPPFISEFDVMDVQLKEGDNAALECNAKGTPAPNVTWTYNNTHWHIDKTSLSATNITSQYEGVYRCDALNKAGATYIVYRVTVVFAAKLQHIVAYTNGVGHDVTSVVEVVQGSNIRIACKATGNPIPDIQWLKQGRELSENRYDIDYADLMLNDVDPGQAGIYTCVASNEGGTDNRRIKLEVLEPPKIFQTLFDPTNTTREHIEVISGQSFYLHCHPYGNPLPEVYWFKNDVPLRLFDDTMVSTEFGEVIVVKKALEEQSGTYMCVARNKVGNTSVTYQVDVLVPPPTPKESTKKVVARFGKPLTLACPELGTRPDVIWIKHPYTEISAGERIMITEDRFTLVIHKTEVSDSGKYSCILTNKVGTTEVTFDVVVQKAPSIAGNVGADVVEEHVVPMRRSVVLKCEVDGHPQPIITWLKDTQQLSESVSNIQRVLGNSLLAIWSVTARDAGQYICLAESKAGTAHRRYNVAVQVPAKWSAWSSWSLCNVTCGLGHQSRARLCHYTDEHYNTIDSSTQSEKIILDMSGCKGAAEDKRKCHMPPCEVDEWKPRWSQWSHWSECSATCGSATQARTRRCKSKATCEGDNVQIRKCTDLPSCYPAANASDDDSKQDSSDANPYSPEITFEMEPEEINSLYSPDIEQFYSASDSDSSPVFFDVEVTENLDGSENGPCRPGFTYQASNNTCDDVDECTVETNQCHMTQVCVNTEGGYRCSCSPGYLALGAGQRCMDINECDLETDGCEYSCVNTAGGYVCACPKHLRLHLDKHHCVIPSLYRRPYGEGEAEYLSTTIDLPTKYSPNGGR